MPRITDNGSDLNSGPASRRGGTRGRVGIFWKINVRAATVLILAAMAFSASSCGGGGSQMSVTWEDDPIVPGFSLAEVNIGDPFSAAQAVHGEPEEHRKDGGYHFAYYGRLIPEGSLDAPGTWHLVITAYDNGNGYLDGDDEIGAVEVSAPYTGKTAGGVGIGSSAEEVEAEFGPCQSVTADEEESGDGGISADEEESGDGELRVFSYTSRGVDFLISDKEGVIMVMVTAYGGLRNVEDTGSDTEPTDGLFGARQAAPVIPGQTLADINVGDEYRSVKEKYGSPDSSGFTTEELVFATYTGGSGPWKLNVYCEDKDQSNTLGDFDIVVSISVRAPYAGKTPKGTAIGSPQSAVIAEFGAPERQTILKHQGEETIIMEYNSKGIVFALNAVTSTVVEIDVNRPLSP